MHRCGLEEASLLEHEIMLTAKLLLVVPAIPIIIKSNLNART